MTDSIKQQHQVLLVRIRNTWTQACELIFLINSFNFENSYMVKVSS
jgi:hypothetical protein